VTRILILIRIQSSFFTFSLKKTLILGENQPRLDLQLIQTQDPDLDPQIFETLDPDLDPHEMDADLKPKLRDEHLLISQIYPSNT